MTKDEALKLALVALENIEKIRVYEGLAWIPHSLEDSAITAIKKALSQPEPVEETPEQHDYRLACESVEGADHTPPPSEQPEQEPLEYWNAVEGWVKIDEVRQHFETVSCGTIYKKAGEGRVPLYTAPPKRKPLTDQRINEVYQEATCQSLRPQDYKLVREFARAIEAAHDIKELLK
jgi:hypothetical protein